MFLKRGKLLHHFTNLNRRLSAMLVSVCTMFSPGSISRVECSFGLMENHKCSTSIISCADENYLNQTALECTAGAFTWIRSGTFCAAAEFRVLKLSSGSSALPSSSSALGGIEAKVASEFDGSSSSIFDSPEEGKEGTPEAVIFAGKV